MRVVESVIAYTIPLQTASFGEETGSLGDDDDKESQQSGFRPTAPISGKYRKYPVSDPALSHLFKWDSALYATLTRAVCLFLYPRILPTTDRVYVPASANSIT